MVEAITTYVRYEIPDDKGETRRQRNERLNLPSPIFHIPENGKYVWDWFKDITSTASTTSEGFYKPVPFSEYLAWQQLTKNIVYAAEYDIMFAMDVAFCDEMNKEIESRRASESERQKREMELNSRVRGKR